MYGRFSEHRNNSVLLQFVAQAGQGINKARRGLGVLPRLHAEPAFLHRPLEITQPDGRIQPQAQRRGPFRSLPFLGLRFLSTQKLFGVVECILCVVHHHIGRKQIVVLQTLGNSNMLDRRMDRIPPAAGVVHLAAAVMEQGVVQSHRQDATGAQFLDHLHGQSLTQSRHLPLTIGKEMMGGVVGISTGRIGIRQHPCDGTAGSAQYSAGHQMNKFVGPQCRKNRKKLSKRYCPCQKYCKHIDLPVLILIPIKTSVGRYVFDKVPLKSVT